MVLSYLTDGNGGDAMLGRRMGGGFSVIVGTGGKRGKIRGEIWFL